MAASAHIRPNSSRRFGVSAARMRSYRLLSLSASQQVALELVVGGLLGPLDAAPAQVGEHQLAQVRERDADLPGRRVPALSIVQMSRGLGDDQGDIPAEVAVMDEASP